MFTTSPAPIVINRSPCVQFSSKKFSISSKVGKYSHGVPSLPDFFLKISGGDAEVIGLTGCINICKDYVVCQCQSLCKFRKQMLSYVYKCEAGKHTRFFCVDNYLLHEV